jgi:hypothetical protein
MSKKKQKVKWREENGRHVAVLPNSASDQVTAHRRANRELAKAAGMLGKSSGSGYHGGGKHVANRRDRRDGKQAFRQGRFDRYCGD